MRAGALAIASLLLVGGSPDAPSRAPITARLDVLEVEPVGPGERGELSLIVLDAPDRALPLAIRIEPGALSLADNRLDWAAVVDPLATQPRVRVEFRAPREPGSYPVVATVEYWVCAEQWCRRKQGEVGWTVSVR